jgi:hypothetical protein
MVNGNNQPTTRDRPVQRPRPAQTIDLSTFGITGRGGGQSLERLKLLGSGEEVESFPGELRERAQLAHKWLKPAPFEVPEGPSWLARVLEASTRSGVVPVPTGEELFYAPPEALLSVSEFVNNKLQGVITADVEAAQDLADQANKVASQEWVQGQEIVRWKITVLDMLTAKEGRYLSEEDILSRLGTPDLIGRGGEPGPAQRRSDLKAEDMEWLRGIIEAVGSVPPPEDKVDTDFHEDQAKVLEALSRKQSISAYPLAHAAGINLTDILRHKRKPSLPPDMTIEDIREIALQVGIAPSDMDAVLLSFTDKTAIDVIGENYRQGKLLASAIYLDVGNATNEELAKMMREKRLEMIFSKGALGLIILEPMAAYFEMIQRNTAPWIAAGAVLTGFGDPELRRYSPFSGVRGGRGLAPTTGFTERQREWIDAWKEGRSRGDTIQHALEYASNNTAFNGWERFTHDILGDPFTYVGWGLLGKPFNAVRLTSIGSKVTAMEKWYMNGVDAVTMGAIKTVGWAGAKTTSMVVGDMASTVLAKLNALSGKVAGKPFLELLPSELRSHLREGVTELIAEGGKAGGDRVEMGRLLVVRQPLEEDEVLNVIAQLEKASDELMSRGGRPFRETVAESTLSRALATGELSPVELADLMLTMDDGFRGAFGLGSKVFASREEAADFILDALTKNGRITRSQPVKRALVQAIQDYQERVLTGIDTIMMPHGREVPTNLVAGNIIRHMEEVFLAQRTSRIAARRGRMTGSTAWLKHNVPHILLSAQAFMDSGSRMVARQFLLFPAYGVGNVVETLMKSWLSGIHVPLRATLGTLGRPGAGNTMSAHLRKISIELIGLPGKFIEEIDVVSHMQLGSESTARSSASGSKSSVNTVKRILGMNEVEWTTIANPLKSDSLFHETLIRRPGRIGTAIEANYISQQFLKNIELFAAVESNFVKGFGEDTLIPTLLRNTTLSPTEAHKLAAEFYVRTMTGNEDLMRALITDYHFGEIDSSKVRELLNQKMAIPNDVSNMLMEEVMSGRVWIRTEQVFEELREKIKLNIIGSPILMAKQFESVVDTALGGSINNAETFVSRVKILAGLAEEYQSNLGTQRKQLVDLMQDYTTAEARHAFLGSSWDNNVGTLMNVADTKSRALIAQLRNIVDAVDEEGFLLMESVSFGPLSPGQVGEFSKTLDAFTSFLDSVKRVREGEARLIRHINQKPKFGGIADVPPTRAHPDYEEYVEEVLRAKQVAWSGDGGLESIHNSWAVVEGMLEDLSGVPQFGGLKKGSWTVGRDFAGGRASPTLTPLRIAELFSAHPHDLVRGLYEPTRGMFKTKAEFVARVQAKALKVLGKETDLNETIFRKFELERVYDQILSNVDGEPVFSELASLRAELMQYGQQRGALMSPQVTEVLEEQVETFITSLKETHPHMFMREEPRVSITDKIDHIQASEVTRQVLNPNYTDIYDPSSPFRKSDNLGRSVVGLRPRNTFKLTDDLVEEVENTGVNPTSPFDAVHETRQRSAWANYVDKEHHGNYQTAVSFLKAKDYDGLQFPGFPGAPHRGEVAFDIVPNSVYSFSRQLGGEETLVEHLGSMMYVRGYNVEWWQANVNSIADNTINSSRLSMGDHLSYNEMINLGWDDAVAEAPLGTVFNRDMYLDAERIHSKRWAEYFLFGELLERVEQAKRLIDHPEWHQSAEETLSYLSMARLTPTGSSPTGIGFQGSPYMVSQVRERLSRAIGWAEDFVPDAKDSLEVFRTFQGALRENPVRFGAPGTEQRLQPLEDFYALLKQHIDNNGGGMLLPSSELYDEVLLTRVGDLLDDLTNSLTVARENITSNTTRIIEEAKDFIRESTRVEDVAYNKARDILRTRGVPEISLEDAQAIRDHLEFAVTYLPESSMTKLLERHTAHLRTQGIEWYNILDGDNFGEWVRVPTTQDPLVPFADADLTRLPDHLRDAYDPEFMLQKQAAGELLPDSQEPLTNIRIYKDADEWSKDLSRQVSWNDLNAEWASTEMAVGTQTGLRDTMAAMTKLDAFGDYTAKTRAIVREVFGDEITVFRGVRSPFKYRMGDPVVEGARPEIPVNLSVSADADIGLDFMGSYSGVADTGVIKVDDIAFMGNIRESEFIVDENLFISWSEVHELGDRVGRNWNREVRQPALDRAVNSYRLDHPNYDNNTIMNSVMKSIFPFWTYEAHRWPWLAREWMRHPGIMANQQKYMENTELGYVSMPEGAPFGLEDLQFNILRGSIFMGGMRRLLMQDFPEYYDNFPGVANAFDWASRFGFYPNIFIGGAMATAGMKMGPAQWGEILPPAIQTPLDIFSAANPDSIVAQRLNQLVFNNRYRDYNTAQYVSKAGFNGAEILQKIRLGDPLSEEEQIQWSAGLRSTAKLNIFMTQAPFFRLRPLERRQFQEDSRKLIAELSGISVATQLEMKRAGMWLEDYMPMHPQHAELLRELDGWSRWGGMTTHLRETMTGSAQAIWRRFWANYTEAREGNQLTQLDYDRRLALQWLDLPDPEGKVTIDVWDFNRRKLGEANRAFFDATRSVSKYFNPVSGKLELIPVSLEERTRAAEQMGYDAPILHAVEELQAELFKLDPEDFLGPDPETKIERIDWDAYYDWQEAVLDAARPDLRKEVEDWLSKSLTPFEKLRREDWKQWVVSYRGYRTTVMRRFTEEEQITIKEYLQSSDTHDLVRLRAVERADGSKLISQYTSQVTKVRQDVRTVDPEMDAILNVWGEVSSFMTTEAEQRYHEIREKYARSVLS